VKDWRGHIDEMHSHQKSIEDALKETSSQLTRLHEDIHRTLEKVTSRENYLNNHLDQPLINFRTTQDHLAEVKEQYRQASGGVTERTRALTEVFCNLSFRVSVCMGIITDRISREGKAIGIVFLSIRLSSVSTLSFEPTEL